jgi:hypothetical protein
VLSLDRLRIERALAGRARYKYVKPKVMAEGAGWKIVSPNCSRSIDATGGPIDIAWFEPVSEGLWRLHARDHAHAAWVAKGEGVTLPEALARVLADTLHEFWA